MLANVLTVANILLSLLIVYASAQAWRASHWWVYLAFAATWAAWAALYTWVLFADPSQYDSAWFGQTFIRPLNTWSFGIVAAVMVFRWRNVTR